MTTNHTLATRRLLTVPGLALAATLAVQLPSAAAEPSALTCGVVISTDVQLHADLLDCPGPGLVIGAPGVTIDLAGHTIDGTGSGAGIDNSAGHDNVTVANGTVQQFLFGVELFEARGARIDRLTALANADGIKIARSERLTLSRVTASANRVNGVEITFGEQVTVRHSTAAGNGLYGVVDRFSAGSRHEANTLAGNHAAGLTIDRTTRAVITGNHAQANASDGIELVALDDARVTGNRAMGNAGNGISADLGGNRFARNVARDNQGIGIAAPAGTIDGGGNRAGGNLGGNCTGVSC
jgi:nitrous oxidase accessory protein NosD